MGLVIDTSALAAAERAGTAWDEALRPLAAEPVVVPAIVYAELVVGVELADTPLRAAARRAKVAALLARVPLVEFGREVAERWGELVAHLSGRGALIPANDLAVASNCAPPRLRYRRGATRRRAFPPNSGTSGRAPACGLG